MSKSTKPAKKITATKTATKTAANKKKKTAKQAASQAVPVWLQPPAVEPEKKSWWVRLKEWF